MAVPILGSATTSCKRSADDSAEFDAVQSGGGTFMVGRRRFSGWYNLIFSGAWGIVYRNRNLS